MSADSAPGMHASADDELFEEIYKSIPYGLTVVAAKFDHFETLQSFCRSLKGTAIRQNSNAMFFWWEYSKQKWLARGLEHFREFIERHSAYGAGLFMIDQPMGWVDIEVAKRIREFAESAKKKVLLTEIAEPPRKDGMERTVVLEDGHMVFSARSAIGLMCRSTIRVERKEIPFPSAAVPKTLSAPERKREALRNLAERPGTEAEGNVAREALARLDSRHGPIATVESPPFRRLIVEQSEVVLLDDFYSARTVFGGEVKRYGPLYFLKECPQPPDGWPRGSSK